MSIADQSAFGILNDLVNKGYTIQIEHTVVPTEYEVTVFYGKLHSHFGGDTLVEACLRAEKAMSESKP